MKAAVFVCLLALLAAPTFAKRSLAQAPSGVTDIDIANFALNLEYLEAEFYSCAATGSPIPDQLRGGGPPSIGCQKAHFYSTDAQAYATELANDEINHVRVLRQALGDAAVAIPQLNIGDAFAAAADAAFEQTLSPAFSPYLNELFFYHGAFIFEDVGVTAYLGAAGNIQDPTIFETAAKILAVEAYHAGAIRTLLYQERSIVTPYNVTVADIVEAIATLRQRVGGGVDQGIVGSDSNDEANIVPADPDSLASARTPTQVMEIVTLGGGPPGGGFFPNGLNGVDALTAASSS